MKRVKIVFLACASLLLGCDKEDVTPKVNAPTLLRLTVMSYSRIDLKWTDNSANETGFLIERSEDNLTYSQLSIVNANVTTFSDTDLKPGTKYYYHVSGLNGKTTSEYSFSYITTRAKTVEEKLAVVWKLTDVIKNSISEMDNCSKDDTWEFDLNKGFTINDNALQCGNEGQNDFVGSWLLNNDKTKIRLTTVEGQYIIMSIGELTDLTLKLKSEGSNPITFCFKR